MRKEGMEEEGRGDDRKGREKEKMRKDTIGGGEEKGDGRRRGKDGRKRRREGETIVGKEGRRK